jgi:hypothetical protein
LVDRPLEWASEGDVGRLDRARSLASQPQLEMLVALGVAPKTAPLAHSRRACRCSVDCGSSGSGLRGRCVLCARVSRSNRRFRAARTDPARTEGAASGLTHTMDRSLAIRRTTWLRRGSAAAFTLGNGLPFESDRPPQTYLDSGEGWGVARGGLLTRLWVRQMPGEQRLLMANPSAIA